jgi:hypothetical protein
MSQDVKSVDIDHVDVKILESIVKEDGWGALTPG